MEIRTPWRLLSFCRVKRGLDAALYLLSFGACIRDSRECGSSILILKRGYQATQLFCIGTTVKMVVLTTFPPPAEGIRHKQENTQAHVAGKNMGDGTLYIAERWAGVATRRSSRSQVSRSSSET